MTKILQTLSFAALCSSVLPAQGPASMLFSPKQEETTRSGSGGTSLAEIQRNAVAMVTPTPALAHSAELFMPDLAWQTMIGDEDADGDVYTRHLTGGIDAVLVLPYVWNPVLQQPVPRSGPIDARDVFISPVEDVGVAVSGAPGLRKGDCGTIVRIGGANGQVMHFIRAEQIIQALGLVDANGQSITPAELNLDGIAVDKDRNILLTFEETQLLRRNLGAGPVTFTLEDGGIAMIPWNGWTPDVRGNVASVVAWSGVIVGSEAGVDAMVANAKPADAAGGCPVEIGDTDGLEVDPNGGAFTVTWLGNGYSIPNLLFCGEKLSGAGVLSMAGGGSIALVNGTALANACGAATLGDQIGLAPAAGTGSLDGLAVLDREPCRFVVKTSTPTGLGGVVAFDIGTNLPVPNTVLFLGVGALPVSPSVDARGFFPTSVCFPEIYLNAITGFPVALGLGPDGWGDRFVSWAFGLPMIAPGVVAQAATIFAGNIEFSTPITVH